MLLHGRLLQDWTVRCQKIVVGVLLRLSDLKWHLKGRCLLILLLACGILGQLEAFVLICEQVLGKVAGLGSRCLEKDVTWTFREGARLPYDLVSFERDHADHANLIVTPGLSPEALVRELLLDVLQEGLVLLSSVGVRRVLRIDKVVGLGGLCHLIRRLIFFIFARLCLFQVYEGHSWGGNDFRWRTLMACQYLIQLLKLVVLLVLLLLGLREVEE